MSPTDLPITWLVNAPSSPPFSERARRACGYLLRQLQRGGAVEMPHSRPMPSVGKSCHELRIPDGSIDWRILYRIDADTILLIEIFQKKSRKTPKPVIELCQQRISLFDRLSAGEE